jgi:hypothetical protein
MATCTPETTFPAIALHVATDLGPAGLLVSLSSTAMHNETVSLQATTKRRMNLFLVFLIGLMIGIAIGKRAEREPDWLDSDEFWRNTIEDELES